MNNLRAAIPFFMKEKVPPIINAIDNFDREVGYKPIYVSGNAFTRHTTGNMEYIRYCGRDNLAKWTYHNPRRIKCCSAYCNCYSQRQRGE